MALTVVAPFWLSALTMVTRVDDDGCISPGGYFWYTHRRSDPMRTNMHLVFMIVVKCDTCKIFGVRQQINCIMTSIVGNAGNRHDIKNNAWVTVNNDFLSRVRRFGNDFHEWRSHEWKSLTNRLTSDKKIVIHGNECIILFLTCYFMSWTHRSAKNYHWALISPLLPSAAFSGAALWRHHNWSVTSCEREILVLWRHICLLSLHVQTGAKAIFTSE